MEVNLEIPGRPHAIFWTPRGDIADGGNAPPFAVEKPSAYASREKEGLQPFFAIAASLLAKIARLLTAELCYAIRHGLTRSPQPKVCMQGAPRQPLA